MKRKTLLKLEQARNSMLYLQGRTEEKITNHEKKKVKNFIEKTLSKIIKKEYKKRSKKNNG